MEQHESTGSGLTRRDLLRRGAFLGGAVVWATPVVQTVGMAPAFAKIPSEGTCCLRLDFSASVAGSTISMFWTVSNCGSTALNQVVVRIDEEANNSGVWTNVVTDTINNLAVGGSAPDSDTTNPNVGSSYRYRARAAYVCLTTPNAGPQFHDVPGTQGDFVFAGPFSV